MEQLHVRMNELLLTQGMVGYKKILENYGEVVETTHDGILVEKQHLEVIPEAFFQYYLKKYSVAKREEQSIRSLHKQFKDGNSQAKRTLNTKLNDLKKSAHRYFKETVEGEVLGEAADSYRSVKKYDEKLDDYINSFIESLHTQIINKKLTSNVFKSVQLRAHYGQVSFLNISHNNKTIEEQKEIFYKDFIVPIFEEWNLFHALEANDESKIESILNATTNKNFNSIKRAFKKLTLDEKKEFVDSEIFQCSLTEFPFAFHNFEEGIFSPLALSIGNARNMSWNANHRSYFPISSLARLFIFCAHAGATDTQSKYVFVYYGGTFDEIYRTNQSYDSLKGRNKSLDQIVFDIAREHQLKAQYANNRYMIYEYESDYQLKRTILDYMIMTPSLIRLFSENRKLFNYIHYSTKNEMVRLLLNNIDSKQFISEQLRNKITQNYSVLDIIQLIQIRHLHQLYKREVKDVDNNIERRRVWALVKSAEIVKRKIGAKKAQGIAYRLLNSVRSNDKNTFMDTVMRVYISTELEMPGLLLEALHEDKMDFATVGNAWISGLVTKNNENKEGESDNE